MANLHGTSADDTIYGTQGDDVITDDVGNDRLRGRYGDDSLAGGGGHDHLAGDYAEGSYAGDGHDTLIGGVGLDTLFGGGGDDRLNGGADADTLEGGLGDDTMSGDSGGDRFVLDASLAYAAQSDRVTDFSQAEGDRIDVSRLGISASASRRRSCLSPSDRNDASGEECKRCSPTELVPGWNSATQSGVARNRGLHERTCDS